MDDSIDSAENDDNVVELYRQLKALWGAHHELREENYNYCYWKKIGLSVKFCIMKRTEMRHFK